jgi:hypothetical protein
MDFLILLAGSYSLATAVKLFLAFILTLATAVTWRGDRRRLGLTVLSDYGLRWLVELVVSNILYHILVYIQKIQ